MPMRLSAGHNARGWVSRRIGGRLDQCATAAPPGQPQAELTGSPVSNSSIELGIASSTSCSGGSSTRSMNFSALTDSKASFGASSS
ncbi:hypothetical protein ZWY2020_026218 [Hordeum vulgare]|nr:hypothetical protein ZWY2020_026218 [Hordeum vulgare]